MFRRGQLGKPSARGLAVTACNWPSFGALSASRAGSLAKQGVSDDGSRAVPGVTVPDRPARLGAGRPRQRSRTACGHRHRRTRSSRPFFAEGAIRGGNGAGTVGRPGRAPRFRQGTASPFEKGSRRRSGRHPSTALPPPVNSRAHASPGHFLLAGAGRTDTMTTRRIRVVGPSRPA